jgi:hypothetical protein
MSRIVQNVTETETPYAAALKMLGKRDSLKYRYAREIQRVPMGYSEVIYVLHHGTVVAELSPNGWVTLHTPIMSRTTLTTMNEWLPPFVHVTQKSDPHPRNDPRSPKATRESRKRWWIVDRRKPGIPTVQFMNGIMIDCRPEHWGYDRAPRVSVAS